MRWWVLFAAGCYAPSPPAGAPCAENGECPAGLACVGGFCGGSVVAGDAPVDDAPLLVGDGPPVDVPPGLDAGPDAALPQDCWAAWSGGIPAITTPLRIAAVSLSGADETNPSFSSDGLVLYFDRNGDLYRSVRPSRTSPFGSPVEVTELSSTADEGKVALPDGDLTVVFASNRTPILGDYDLWTASRMTVMGTFNTPSRLSGLIDSAASQVDPWISADGLTLYYAEVGPVSTQVHLMRASRSVTSATFAGAQQVSIDSATLPYDPEPSPDERTLLYSDSGALVVANRTIANGAFKTAGPLAGIPSQADDPALSRDGCELVFVAPQMGSLDIFHAFVVP